MSFILDALKKSENERQRTVGPSLADAPARLPQSDRPWWAVAVAGLLVGNLAVLLYVLLRNDAPAPAATTPAATANTVVPAPTVQRPRVSRETPRPSVDAAVRSLAEEAGTPEESFDEEGEFSDSAAMADSGSPSAMRSVNPPAVTPLSAATQRDPGANSNEVLPHASSLIASGTSLPDLRLDIHVFSNNPAERFVFINMRKYTEGQSTSEGPTVERITPDGAILNQQGLRFVLPRQ